MGRDIPQEEIDEALQFEEDLKQEEREDILERMAADDPDLVFVQAHTRRKPKPRERLTPPEIAEQALEASSPAAPVATPTQAPGLAPGGVGPPGAGAAAGGGFRGAGGLLGKAGAVGGIIAGGKAAFDALAPPEQLIGHAGGRAASVGGGGGGGVGELRSMLKLMQQAADFGYPQQTDAPAPQGQTL